jgi:diguanylate cyclase (GGDEF)-like protein
MAGKRKDFSITMNIGDVVDDVIQVDARDRAYLIVLTGAEVGQMFKLSNENMLIGRTDDADITLHDDGISRTHARIWVDDDGVQIEDLGSRNGTYCNGTRIEKHTLGDGDKIHVGRTTVLKFTYQDELDESFSRQMYDSALSDALTQAANRRHLLERIDSELSYALRHQVPLSVVMLDLDHFKGINDQHGHLAGDQALVALAQCIRDQIRNEDIFGRYGGEEFMVVCRGIRQAQAGILAERLRSSIAALALEHEGKEVRLTASFGVAGLPEVPARTVSDLIAAADRALYAAKDAGRNCVVVAEG